MSSTPESSGERGRRRLRPSRITRDPVIKVLAAVDDADDVLCVELGLEGFRIERCAPEAIDRVAVSSHAEALLVDADSPGALAAVARVRRSDGVLATIPIVLIGTAGAALHTSLDAVEAGGDAFVPRPAPSIDVADRLRALLEIPVQGPSRSLAPSSGAELPPAALAPSIALPPPPRVPGKRADAGAMQEPSASTGLSPELTDVLRQAALRAGASENELALPSLDDSPIDDLVPPELLEPLDAPLEVLADEILPPATQTAAPGHAAGPGPRRTTSSRNLAAVSAPRAVAPTPTITPLTLGGESRLSGTLGAYGMGIVLGAAARSRASGLLIVRSAGVQYDLALAAGHLLALRSSSAEHDTGALLARLGAIPREAARFANAPLDAGVRGAALIAARGYLTASALSLAVARAARELLFDLIAPAGIEWEMRPLETAVEIPLAPRALDALLVLGARARIEPEAAGEALGGLQATLALRPEAGPLAALPLERIEREVAEQARGRTLAAIAEAAGLAVLPAVLALAWLGLVRVDGAHGPQALAPSPPATLAQERTRVRALVEAAEAHDYFALLGVSEWSTRSAAREALEARRSETAGLASRHPDVDALGRVVSALDDLARLLDDAPAWNRYVSALRDRSGRG